MGGPDMFKTLCFAVLACSASLATAAPITYNVNQTIGLGSVVGSIQTNGAIGDLSQSDILGFMLTVTGPGASVQLSEIDSIVREEGSNLSASATDLFFDFSGASGFLLFQKDQFGTGMKYYCNSSVNNDCFQGASAISESFNSMSAQVEGRVGMQVIASVGMVPEPRTWAMMLLGFGMIGAGMRYRRARTTVSFA